MARETNIHAGHRKNMRAKLLASGPSAFLPHELTEMLLFSAIPLCDTNPAAHRLLDTFGGLYGVLRQDVPTLCTVPGIGPRAAELITLARATAERAERRYHERCSAPGATVFHDIRSLFKGESGDVTYAVYLDNACRILGTERILEGRVSYSGLPIKTILSSAVRAHSAILILATSHASRVAQASEHEIAASRALREALDVIGIRFAEYFIFSGSYHAVISEQVPGMLRDNSDLRDYLADTEEDEKQKSDALHRTRNEEDMRLLADLLEIACKGKGEEIASELFFRYGDLDGILCASCAELYRAAGETVGALLSLLMPLYARAMLEAGGKRECLTTAVEQAEYLAAHFVGIRTEVVYLLLLDEQMRPIHTERVSEGTVTRTSVDPRCIVELAIFRGAAYAVLAHNHPAASPIPSGEDLTATELLADALSSTGVPLLEHFVFALGRATPILLWASSPHMPVKEGYYGEEMPRRVARLRTEYGIESASFGG